MSFALSAAESEASPKGWTFSAAPTEMTRRSHPHKRRYSQSVSEAGNICVRRAGQVVITGNDMGVECSVAIAALHRAPGVRCSLEAVINNAARGAHNTLDRPKWLGDVVASSIPLSLTSTANPDEVN